jgi:hypothetical protein
MTISMAGRTIDFLGRALDQRSIEALAQYVLDTTYAVDVVSSQIFVRRQPIQGTRRGFHGGDMELVAVRAKTPPTW